MRSANKVTVASSLITLFITFLSIIVYSNPVVIDNVQQIKKACEIYDEVPWEGPSFSGDGNDFIPLEAQWWRTINFSRNNPYLVDNPYWNWQVWTPADWGWNDNTPTWSYDYRWVRGEVFVPAGATLVMIYGKYPDGIIPINDGMQVSVNSTFVGSCGTFRTPSGWGEGRMGASSSIPGEYPVSDGWATYPWDITGAVNKGASNSVDLFLVEGETWGGVGGFEVRAIVPPNVMIKGPRDTATEHFEEDFVCKSPGSAGGNAGGESTAKADPESNAGGNSPGNAGGNAGGNKDIPTIELRAEVTGVQITGDKILWSKDNNNIKFLGFKPGEKVTGETVTVQGLQFGSTKVSVSVDIGQDEPLIDDHTVTVLSVKFVGLHPTQKLETTVQTVGDEKVMKAGIRYKGLAHIPAGCEGTLQFVQNVKANNTVTFSDGSQFLTTTEQKYALDTKDPAVEGKTLVPGTKDLYALDLEDIPDWKISLWWVQKNLVSHISTEEDFKLFFMWKPLRGERETLGLANWSWHGKAVNSNGDLIVDESVSKVEAQIGSSSDEAPKTAPNVVKLLKKVHVIGGRNSIADKIVREELTPEDP